MAGQVRNAAPRVEGQLFEEGYRFEFLQAVRLLQLRARAASPVGSGEDPAREAVRFESSVSPVFPASEIGEIRDGGDGPGPATATVNFMGVATPGSFGSLPRHYGQLARSEESAGRTALRDFFDLFNNRMLGLFYRAWQRRSAPIEFESAPEGQGGRFERVLLALLGLGSPGLAHRMSFGNLGILSAAEAVGTRRLPPAALEDRLGAFFGAEIRVLSFQPRWHKLAPGDEVRLGGRGRLGIDFYPGSAVLTVQQSFRVRVLALSRSKFEQFLPGAKAHRSLVEMLRLLVGPEFECDFELQLDPLEAPGFTLAADDTGMAGRPRLGWSTWLLAPGCAEPASCVVPGL